MATAMRTENLRQRHPPASVLSEKLSHENTTPIPQPTTEQPEQQEHPGGPIKHGGWMRLLRLLLFALYFNGSAMAICVTQFIGAPLYWYNKNYFYAWMAVTKQHFGLVITTMTHWWAPVKMVVSGDESMRGQLRLTEDGRLECDFPERMILIANHQIYTDWIYLWWIAYTANMHGHIYIILKESIKYIPVMGTGMMFYGFIFLSRKWAKDKERFAYRLRKLNSSHSGPMSGTHTLDPMWLLIFPEGTNLSGNGRKNSTKWADKNNMPDLRHAMLPRSTGLLYCISELQKTTEWMYDCTVAYEGVPRGQYGQDLFTLQSTYFEGRSPKSVNMYWRRFATKDIPTDDQEFSDWLLKRWREKDDLLEYFLENGRFPADEGVTKNVNGGKPLKGAGHLVTDIRPKNPLEFLQVFVPVASLALVINNVIKMANIVLRVLRIKN